MKQHSKTKKDFILPEAKLRRNRGVLCRERNGKFQSESTVLFHTVLVCDDGLLPDTVSLTGKIEASFLRFAKERSQERVQYDRFAYLSILPTENALAVKAAFCPFEKKEFFAVGEIRLDNDGQVQSVVLFRRSHRRSHSS